jgi:hypothetical protein
MKLGGTGARLIRGTDGSFMPSWSRRTGRIAFVRFPRPAEGVKYASEMVLIDPDGGRRSVIRP